MSPTQGIVCGIDHSPGARVAARFAMALAKRLGLNLTLVHAVQPPMPQRDVGKPNPIDDLAVFQQLHDAGVALLDEVAQELGPGAEITTLVRVGAGADVIADVAQEDATAFTVVGSRGLGSIGKVILGSVSLRLAANGPVPTVIVPESAETIDDGPIFCAVDDSDQARHAVATAVALAERLGVELVLAHVQEDDRSSSHGSELLARLASEHGLGAAVELIVVQGEPAGALVTAADARRAEMIVMGSRGRGALVSSVLGSVSSAVTERATSPVVIVRDRELAAADAS